MHKAIFKAAVILAAASFISACSDYLPNMSGLPGFSSNKTSDVAAKNGTVGATVDQKTGQDVPVNITMSGGEAIGLKSMDELDKSKMSHALDSPPGKSTHWQNGATGIDYTVTPIKKIVVNGNPFCRQYQVLIQKGEYKRDMTGNACVTTDGTWHTV